MNKIDFVKKLSKEKGVSYYKAYRAVNDVMDTIRVLLVSGEKIEIGGFGTFEVIYDLKGQQTPVFQGGRAFKRALNKRKTKSE